MNRNFLLFWNVETAFNILNNENDLEYVTSNQFYRVSEGDVIWAVTVKKAEIFLLGRLTIGEMVDHMSAVKRLGHSVWGNKDYYALAAPGTLAPIKLISIANIAKDIRFISKDINKAKLAIDGENMVNAQQLQTMRLLDESTADLLESIWLKN